MTARDADQHGLAMGVRLAVVQHGDYREGLDIVARDLPEPYFGMKDSIDDLERFVADVEHCIVSVDAPRYTEKRRRGQLIGLHRPGWPKLSKLAWAWNTYRAVRAFRPTHLLMRTGGILALPTLQYAVRRRLPTLVLMAGYMDPRSWRNRVLARQLVRLLNSSAVFRVGNHRRPAALSTIEAGVCAEKVVAWDFRGVRRPEHAPARSLRADREKTVVFAGVLKEGKGIGDLVDALSLLRREGRFVRLVVCGDGPLMPELIRRQTELPKDALELLGKVGNDQVQRQMQAADVVCVPSRRDRSEGLPFTVTEALACRTPLITCDHPAITTLLKDGEGVRIVPSADPPALARALHEVLTDGEVFAQLSRSAVQAFRRLEAEVTFEQILRQWRATWQPIEEASHAV